MPTLLESSHKSLTINQTIKEIKEVFHSCNHLNIAELVQKNILEPRIICNEYIGLMTGYKLNKLLNLVECKPIHQDIVSLIKGEVKELEITEIEYLGQKGNFLIQNKTTDWTIEAIQNLLKSKPYSFEPFGFEYTHTSINIDNLLIDANSLYKYLDIQPMKLMEEIKELNQKLALLKTKVSKTEVKKVSTYSTLALEACQAVIQNFWEDWTPDSTRDVSQTTIKEWILHNFPDLEANAPRHAIDQVCRNPITKTGGKNKKNDIE